MQQKHLPASAAAPTTSTVPPAAAIHNLHRGTAQQPHPSMSAVSMPTTASTSAAPHGPAAAWQPLQQNATDLSGTFDTLNIAKNLQALTAR